MAQWGLATPLLQVLVHTTALGKIVKLRQAECQVLFLLDENGK